MTLGLFAFIQYQIIYPQLSRDCIESKWDISMPKHIYIYHFSSCKMSEWKGSVHSNELGNSIEVVVETQSTYYAKGEKEVVEKLHDKVKQHQKNHDL